MSGMEKNNQPLILGIVVIGAVLIITLALIFTRSNDDTATETPAENNASENQENGEDGQQPTPTPRPPSTSTPTPNPTPAPDPPPGVLSADWESLTPREKTDLNPLGCDIGTQIIWADDGSCHPKPPEDAITEPPEEYLSSRTALDAYLENSEYTQLEKGDAMWFYCDLNPDDCLTWKFISYYDEDDFDRYGRCQTLPREGSFCGDIAAYKRWQEITETAEYASLYEKAEKAWEEYLSRFGDEEIRGNDKEGYILQGLLHSVSPELRLEYGLASTTFAQADIVMQFLK